MNSKGIENNNEVILTFCITQANVDDGEPLKNESFQKAVFGKLYANKGNISEKLQQLLPNKLSIRYHEN